MHWKLCATEKHCCTLGLGRAESYRQQHFSVCSPSWHALPLLSLRGLLWLYLQQSLPFLSLLIGFSCNGAVRPLECCKYSHSIALCPLGGQIRRKIIQCLDVQAKICMQIKKHVLNIRCTYT